MFSNIGTMEIVVIVFVIILLFGAKKIPELFQGLGKGVKEFKKAMNEVESEISKTPTDKSDNTTNKS